MSWFKKVEGWFAKVFANAPKWNVTALAALNIIAPILETALSLADPAVANIVDPIITQIQADLGTTSQLLAAGSTQGLAGLLTAIQGNFSTLLKEAHITDPNNVARATALEQEFSAELQTILAAIPATA